MKHALVAYLCNGNRKQNTHKKYSQPKQAASDLEPTYICRQCLSQPRAGVGKVQDARWVTDIVRVRSLSSLKRLDAARNPNRVLTCNARVQSMGSIQISLLGDTATSKLRHQVLRRSRRQVLPRTDWKKTLVVILEIAPQQWGFLVNGVVCEYVRFPLLPIKSCKVKNKF